jgi:RNA polymerase sigma-70 factor (ECF subfamily)
MSEQAGTLSFEDGVRSRVAQVIAGSDVTVVEAWLDSPADQPLHCPPGLTQIHFHRKGPTSHIVSHYAPRPGASI